jgi:hypothetical protein
VGQYFGPPSVGQPLFDQSAKPAAHVGAGTDNLDVALQAALDHFLVTFQQYRAQAVINKQQLEDSVTGKTPNIRSRGKPPSAAAFMHTHTQAATPLQSVRQTVAVRPTAEERQALNDIMNCLARYRK